MKNKSGFTDEQQRIVDDAELNAIILTEACEVWERRFNQLKETTISTEGLRSLIEDLEQAMRQWRMYAEDHDERDLAYDNDAESAMFRAMDFRLREYKEILSRI